MNAVSKAERVKIAYVNQLLKNPNGVSMEDLYAGVKHLNISKKAFSFLIHHDVYVTSKLGNYYLAEACF